MPEKPTTAAGYRGEHVELVKATCLYVATKLGDLSDYVESVSAIVTPLERLRADPSTIQGIDSLAKISHDGLEPMRVAALIAGGSD